MQINFASHEAFPIRSHHADREFRQGHNYFAKGRVAELIKIVTLEAQGHVRMATRKATSGLLSSISARDVNYAQDVVGQDGEGFSRYIDSQIRGVEQFHNLRPDHPVIIWPHADGLCHGLCSIHCKFVPLFYENRCAREFLPELRTANPGQLIRSIVTNGEIHILTTANLVKRAFELNPNPNPYRYPDPQSYLEAIPKHIPSPAF